MKSFYFFLFIFSNSFLIAQESEFHYVKYFKSIENDQPELATPQRQLNFQYDFKIAKEIRIYFYANLKEGAPDEVINFIFGNSSVSIKPENINYQEDSVTIYYYSYEGNKNIPSSPNQNGFTTPINHRGNTSTTVNPDGTFTNTVPQWQHFNCHKPRRNIHQYLS